VEFCHKAYLGAALAYAVSPIDLLPESRLGVAGYLDDVVVVVAALNTLLNEVDQQIVLEHWSGSADLRDLHSHRKAAMGSTLRARSAGR
jgi:uncharacterized membrane protein YkvA (DUF1232 family)